MKRKLTKIQIKKRGFSLVELAAVITIIGILATIGIVSFTRVQRSARDGRRKADLQAISTALELYYNENYNYPGGAGCVSSTGACCPCDPPGSDWTGTIATALKPTYIKDLPADPKNDTSYYYSYEPICNQTGGVCGKTFTCSGSGNCCQYELQARLEDGSIFSLCSP